MITEPFADGNSWIHKIDPRHRIVSAVLISILLAVSEEFKTLGTGLVLSSGIILAARLNASHVLKRLQVAAGFILLIWIMLPVTFNGNIVRHLGPVAISMEGVVLSAKISLKSISIIMIFMALVATMPAATMGNALGKMGIPDKFVVLLLLTYRYIFVLEQEYHRLWRAAKVRGFRPRTSLHSYKTYAYLIGMLFVKAGARAERVHQAMCCRGFKGKFYSLQHFPSDPRNLIFTTLMSSMLILLILLEYTRLAA